MLDNPYKVPPFNVHFAKPEIKYLWWSWHPCYPRWTKSCWGGTTVDEAFAALNKPTASSELKCCHNKLIREGDGNYTEIYDLPCERLDVWRKIAKGENGGMRETDAKPIEGWENL